MTRIFLSPHLTMGDFFYRAQQLTHTDFGRLTPDTYGLCENRAGYLSNTGYNRRAPIHESNKKELFRIFLLWLMQFRLS